MIDSTRNRRRQCQFGRIDLKLDTFFWKDTHRQVTTPNSPISGQQVIYTAELTSQSQMQREYIHMRMQLNDTVSTKTKGLSSGAV